MYYKYKKRRASNKLSSVEKNTISLHSIKNNELNY